MINKLNEIFVTLPEWSNAHNRQSKTYNFFANRLQKLTDHQDFKSNNLKIFFDQVGEISLPFQEMGNINSTHLFGLDELIIFQIYITGSHRYQKVADIGANIGLHSIILNKLFKNNVDSFEPDNFHINILKKNLIINGIEPSNVYENAVSNFTGKAKFTRLLGNTTGSHLSGEKKNVYGEIEEFEVEVKNITDIIKNYDFLKLDVEGSEFKIFSETSNKHWQHTDAIFEIGNQDLAKLFFEHSKDIGINIYSQKINWNIATRYENLPFGHTEGSIFISLKPDLKIL